MFWRNKIPNGATGHDDPRDRTAEAITDDLRKLDLPKLSPPRSTMNQGKHTHTKSACTIAWAYLQICQIFNKEANNTELLEVVERAHNNMWYDYTGQLSSVWANMAVKRWNAHNEEKLLYIKIAHDDPDLHYLMFDRNFMGGATYKGNGAYGRDYRADGILNNTNFDPSTYWHRTSLYQLWVFDSYVWWSMNEYRLWADEYTLWKLVEDGTFYPTMYVILKESWLSTDIKTIKQEVEEKRLADVFVNSISLFRKHLSTVEKKQISTMATKYRKKYQLDNFTTEKWKIMSITVAIFKTFMDGVEIWKRGNVLEAILSL